jgi:phosphoadenosine phosphosulfate reductase
MIDLEQQKKIVTESEIVNKLQELAKEFDGKIAYSTSLGFEEQVITHLIFANDIPIEVFTIDTWRLFKQTLELKDKLEARYGKKIKVYTPDKKEVEDLVSKKGEFSFYDSIENRKECCQIRKVVPLNQALEGVDCWITGIRAEQSANRQQMQQLEWNEANQLYKFHPLFYWSEEEVSAFIQKHDLPYNPMHDQNFPSIGCEPCTRAIKPEEDQRAGRWWWETSDTKECGLHK